VQVAWAKLIAAVTCSFSGNGAYHGLSVELEEF
jgi:hypothetical protein